MSTQNAIKDRLDEKGWSSVHLAAALRDLGFTTHPFTVQRWADGLSEPRGIALTIAIAKALNCEVRDLVNESVAS